MPKLLPARAARAAVLTAMLVVPALSVAVAVTPAHAATPPSLPTSRTPPYTLSVTGDGARALVFWSTARQGGVSSGTTTGTPITTLPWHKAVTAKADLYQIVAIQQKGTRLRCTIRNTHGTVVSSATSLGRNAVVTCTLSKRELFSLSALG